jgi:hypothetical protein
MLTTTDFCSRSNAALTSGPVAREKLLAGTMRSYKPFMTRMSPPFSIFKHIALRVTEICCINYSAICCGTRGKISYNRGASLADTQSVSEHAGVSPDPVTGMSRFPPGALDAVREEDNLPSPTAPPDYEDHLTPRITINSA